MLACYRSFQCVAVTSTTPLPVRTGLPVRTLVLLPLVSEGRVVGVLEAVNVPRPQALEGNARCVPLPRVRAQ